jgi:hypothetical protein
MQDENKLTKIDSNLSIPNKIRKLLLKNPRLKKDKTQFMCCYYLEYYSKYIPLHLMDNFETVSRELRRILK